MGWFAGRQRAGSSRPPRFFARPRADQFAEPSGQRTGTYSLVRADSPGRCPVPSSPGGTYSDNAMPAITINRRVVAPAMELLPSRMDSARARVMLLAIGLQESRLIHRRQIGGPARGLWQFERGGGVVGVLNHAASRDHARRVCADRNVEPTSQAVYGRLEHDDILAACFARLLLWTDPRPLPQVPDPDGAWDLYLRTWRPGKPHRHTWANLYMQADAAVGAP